MIVALGNSPKGEVLILGLSRENVKRLTAGQPITVPRGTHVSGIEVVIWYGETEQDMAVKLRALGLIGPDTKVTADPSLNS